MYEDTRMQAPLVCEHTRAAYVQSGLGAFYFLSDSPLKYSTLSHVHSFQPRDNSQLCYFLALYQHRILLTPLRQMLKNNHDPSKPA